MANHVVLEEGEGLKFDELELHRRQKEMRGCITNSILVFTNGREVYHKIVVTPPATFD